MKRILNFRQLSSRTSSCSSSILSRTSFRTSSSLSFSFSSSFKTCSFSSSSLSSEDREIRRYLELHNINIKGNDEEYKPMVTFEDTPYPSTIITSLYSEGFNSPTPIQAQSWPIALAGKDLVSVARTGSGKTCAFLLPGFMKILQNSSEQQPTQHQHHHQQRQYGRISKLPQMLVLAPTRELTQQINDEALKFANSSPINILSLYGGTPRGPQMRQLGRGVDVVIGTPGRCNDLLDSGALDLSNVKYLVLDEADRMLDMGFEPQIRTLLDKCHRERQSLFFTATWPKEIAQLSNDYLNKPVNVQIGVTDKLNANKAIQQIVHVVKEFEKSDRLEELLDSIIPDDPSMTLSQKRRACPKTLIFISRKLECDNLAYELRDLGFSVGTLHGDKEQNARTHIMNKYRNGEIRVLVATDVAARGIDIKDIEVVINYDFPPGKQNAVEDYVHRIGRTARGDRTGKAYTFFTAENVNASPALVELLARSEQPIPEELKKLAATKTRPPPPPPPRYRKSNQNSQYNSKPSFDPIASGGGKKRVKTPRPGIFDKNDFDDDYVYNFRR